MSLFSHIQKAAHLLYRITPVLEFWERKGIIESHHKKKCLLNMRKTKTQFSCVTLQADQHLQFHCRETCTCNFIALAFKSEISCHYIYLLKLLSLVCVLPVRRRVSTFCDRLNYRKVPKFCLGRHKSLL